MSDGACRVPSYRSLSLLTDQFLTSSAPVSILGRAKPNAYLSQHAAVRARFICSRWPTSGLKCTAIAFSPILKAASFRLPHSIK